MLCLKNSKVQNFTFFNACVIILFTKKGGILWENVWFKTWD